MKSFFSTLIFSFVAIHSTALARGDTPPMPELNNPPGWPLIGYGLAFLLVGGAVYISLYTSKRTNID